MKTFINNTENSSSIQTEKTLHTALLETLLLHHAYAFFLTYIFQAVLL